MAWQLYDFVDDQGLNAYEVWYDDQDGNTRGRADGRLITIRNAGLQLPNSVTPTREKKILEAELNGKSGAFRIFLCRGPGELELTILGGGREKDTKYVRKRPQIDPEGAESRRQTLTQDFARRRVPHEFAEDDLGKIPG